MNWCSSKRRIKALRHLRENTATIRALRRFVRISIWPVTLNPRKAELVKLRFFAGLTMPEIAQVFRISLATAERLWTYARTWLYAELKVRGNSENP